VLSITPRPRSLMSGTNFPYPLFTSTRKEFVSINPDDQELFSVARSWIASDGNVMVGELYEGQNSRDWIPIDRDEVWRVLLRVTAANAKPAEITLEMHAGEKSVEVRRVPLQAEIILSVPLNCPSNCTPCTPLLFHSKDGLPF
jgi:hypothetical protein